MTLQFQANLSAAQTTWAVAFASAFSAAPSVPPPAVLPPGGSGDGIIAFVTAITTTGCSGTFSAPIPGAGYVLSGAAFGAITGADPESGESAWSAIAEADLDSYWNAPQSAVLKTKALQAPLSDAFTAVAADVANMMRTALAARGPVSSLAASVPPEARIHAIYLILEALGTRIPTLALGKDQKAAADRARLWLADLGDIAKPVVVSMPSAPILLAVAEPRGVKLISSRCRETTREQMRGL